MEVKNIMETAEHSPQKEETNGKICRHNITGWLG